MKCKNCGTDNRSGIRFCKECGAALGEQNEKVQSNAVQFPAQQSISAPSAASNAKKHNPWLPLLLIVVVVIGIICAGFLGLRWYQKNYVQKPTAQMGKSHENSVVTSETAAVTVQTQTTETKPTETQPETVAQVQVPQTQGMPIAEACNAIESTGLCVIVDYAYSDTTQVNCVVSQSIPAGKKVDEGTEITLVVSLGPDQGSILTQSQLNSIRNELGVPADFEVTFELGENYYWGAVGEWLVPVSIIHNGNVIASADVDAETGEVAKNICMYTSNESNSVESVGNWKGQINVHGGIVAGYTSDYVVNGGACTTVRKSLGDGWHVTAKNTCYAYGITWYELWDSDDGDYYGWVDADYIDFY